MWEGEKSPFCARRFLFNMQTLKEEAIGAVARGWTYYQNAGKEFDSELAEAIVQEVLPLITKAYEEGKKDSEPVPEIPQMRGTLEALDKITQ